MMGLVVPHEAPLEACKGSAAAYEPELSSVPPWRRTAEAMKGAPMSDVWDEYKDREEEL